MLDKLMVLLQVRENSLLWTCQVYDRCKKDYSSGLATSQLNGIPTFTGSFIHYKYFEVYIHVTVHRNSFLIK